MLGEAVDGEGKSRGGGLIAGEEEGESLGGGLVIGEGGSGLLVAAVDQEAEERARLHAARALPGLGRARVDVHRRLARRLCASCNGIQSMSIFSFFLLELALTWRDISRNLT